MFTWLIVGQIVLSLHWILTSPSFDFQYAEMSLAHAMIENEDKFQEPVKSVKKKGSLVPYLIIMGQLLLMQKKYEKGTFYCGNQLYM